MIDEEGESWMIMRMILRATTRVSGDSDGNI